jgi:hypothetical protein
MLASTQIQLTNRSTRTKRTHVDKKKRKNKQQRLTIQFSDMHMLNIDIVDDARKTNSLTFVQHEGHGKLQCLRLCFNTTNLPHYFLWFVAIFIDKN